MRAVTSVAFAIGALAMSGAVAADTVDPAVEKLEARSKKQLYLEDKQVAGAAATAAQARDARKGWHHQLDKRIGKKPARIVNIFNTWTHEYVAVELGAKHPPPKRTVDSFLRCHFTNQPTNMDARLFRVLLQAAEHFDADRIEIISGYRADKYNLMLRKKGRGVARNSEHPQGNAVDFRLRGVAVGRLRAWAQRLRLGGVGFYPGSGFVHVDTGKIRTWTDK